MTIPRIPKVSDFHYFFINNIFGSLIEGIGEYFSYELFPRTTELVVGTYSKAVQHYKNRQNVGGEKHQINYPFLTLDPILDIEPEDHEGKFFHSYPNFMLNFATKLYNPVIYEDAHVLIAPVLNRYKGSLELIMWNGSVYESIDNRILAWQFFAGTGRPVFPKNIQSYFILPDNLVYFTYNNPYKKETYQLDWTNNRSKCVLVKNINKTKWVFPFELRPWITLRSINDGEEKYGGDDLGESKLTLDLEWECSIPTHCVVVLKDYPDARKVEYSIGVGKTYSSTLNRYVMRDPLFPIDSTCSECEIHYQYGMNDAKTGINEYIRTHLDKNFRDPEFNIFSFINQQYKDDPCYIRGFYRALREEDVYISDGDDISQVRIVATCAPELDSEGNPINRTKDWIAFESYNYIISIEDIEKFDIDHVITITLPRKYDKINEDIKVYFKLGELQFGWNWSVSDDMDMIELIPYELKSSLRVDDVIDIIYYKPDENLVI